MVNYSFEEDFGGRFVSVSRDYEDIGAIYADCLGELYFKDIEGNNPLYKEDIRQIFELFENQEIKEYLGAE